MAETFISAVISDLHPFYCNWHNEEMTESPISADISNLRYEGEKSLKIRGLVCLQIFLFEPELNACTGLGLAGNCLFLNPKKENDSGLYSSFA